MCARALGVSESSLSKSLRNWHNKLVLEKERHTRSWCEEIVECEGAQTAHSKTLVANVFKQITWLLHNFYFILGYDRNNYPILESFIVVLLPLLLLLKLRRAPWILKQWTGDFWSKMFYSKITKYADKICHCFLSDKQNFVLKP